MPCFEVIKGEANCIEMTSDRDKWCPSCRAVAVVVAPVDADDLADESEFVDDPTPQEEL